MVNKEYSEVPAMIYSGLASTEHLKEWETVYEPCYHWLSNILLEAKNIKEIRQTIDPNRTEKLIIGLIESAAEQVYLFNTSDELEIEYQREAVTEFLFIALDLEKVSS